MDAQAQKTLTNVKEDYLEAVLIIQEKQGTVRSVDLVRFLQVSKASVSIAVTDLRQTGHLTIATCQRKTNGVQAKNSLKSAQKTYKKSSTTPFDVDAGVRT